MFSTSNLEQAIAFLAPYYKRILVRVLYALPLPVRLRASKLDGAYFARRVDTGEISRWTENGGALINYRRELKEPHDVHVFCECPFSLDDLHTLTRHTSEFAVIYKPPSWRAHREELNDSWPQAERCRAFFRAIDGTTMRPDYAEICSALGKPSTGWTAMADADLIEKLGISARQFGKARRAVLRGIVNANYFTVMRLIPRTEPEDKSLLPLYRALLQLPQAGGVSLALNRELYQTSGVYKKQLRALVRCGSVANNGAVGFYAIGNIAPDYDKIQARHETAKLMLEEIISAVDAAPEITIQELRPSRRAQLQPSGAPLPPAAAAPARDTPG